MLSPLAAWRVDVLGVPRVRTLSPESQERTFVLERKPAALLAYLALEGPTPRAALAALLWPDASSGTARNNLVHLLRRLRSLAGGDLINANDALALHPRVLVDARELLDTGDTASEGQLLDAVDASDLPDFSEWLLAQRERLVAARARQYRDAVARRSADGDFAGAVDAATRWTDLDPLGEDAHRALMRAQYDLGDRPAALRAYHRFKDLLARDLGEEPSAETRQLARDIDRGVVVRPGPPERAGRIPVTVRRPPVLVGREDVWATMEDAWERGLGIMLSGEPGSGKTRLALDFLRSKTEYRLLLFEGRPGDAAAPYTTHARTYRQVLEAYPDVALPAWARRELARLVPTLAEDLGGPPPPMTSEADKIRFYDAKVELVRRVAERGPLILASDDVQFMDDASIEAGAYVFSKFWGDGHTNLRTLFCHRAGELSAFATGLLDQMYAAGVVVHLPLGPLRPSDVSALLSVVGVPNAEAVAARIEPFTAGNAQVVLEVLKHLYETGEFDAPPSASGRVGPLIARRLARLSEAARQTARAAAVLRSDFTLELVSEVLGAKPLDTASAWEELEEAQVMTGERFTHDLVPEAILADLAPAVRGVLHRACARVLASHGAAPARVAWHYREGGDARQAAPWLVKAGDAALATLRFSDAHAAYTAAERAFESVGDDLGAANVRRTLTTLAGRLAPTAS